MVDLIKSEKAGGQSSSSDLQLPARHGPARPKTALDSEDSYQYALSLEQTKSLDRASQALLHWACHTSNPETVVKVLENVHLLRNDQGDPARNVYMLTFEDWLQYLSIIRHYTELVPQPDRLEVLTFHHTPNLLLTNGFNPDWAGSPTRLTAREELQLMMIKWVNQSEIDRVVRLYALSKTALPLSPHSRPDKSTQTAFKTMLQIYREETDYWQEVAGVSQKRQAEVFQKIALASISADRPGLTACFIEMLGETLSAPSDGSIGPNARAHVFNPASLKKLASEVMGEDALKAAPAPAPCTRL